MSRQWTLQRWIRNVLGRRSYSAGVFSGDVGNRDEDKTYMKIPKDAVEFDMRLEASLYIIWIL